MSIYKLFLFYFFNSSTVVPLDCSATSCGSLAWITTNTKYVRYFVRANCADGTLLTSLSFEQCFCPSATLLDTCTCAVSTQYPGTVDIDCAGKRVGNDRMTSIISNLPATTPIGILNLNGNDLTVVPPGMAKFMTIAELNLAANQISLVNNGALAVNSSTLMKLNLSNNTQLAAIGNSSLPSKSTNNQRNYYTSVLIQLHFILLLIQHLSCLFSFIWNAD